MPIDLNQITVNVNDIIPPDNFATVDAGSKIGSVYTKEQDNAWRKEVEEITQSGIKGVAKPNTPYDPITNPIPTPWTVGGPNLYEKYDVNEAGIFPNFIKSDNTSVEVTVQELSLNEIQIWVNNGVSEKVLKTLPQANLSFTKSFYDSGFGFSKTANETLVNIAIKSLRFIGNWDKNLKYQIRFISKNDSAEKYSLWIRSVNDAGATLVDAFYKGKIDTLTEAGAGKYTKALFPIDANGRGVEAIIDYNILPASISFTGVNTNTTVNNVVIDSATSIEVSKEVSIAKYFYNGGFGFTKATNEDLVHFAIKNIKLIGNWDSSVNYQVRYLSRNNSSEKYSIWIRTVNSSGATLVDAFYKGKIETVTEAGAGKYTKVTFPTDTNGRSVEAVVDYNTLILDTYSFASVPTNTTINNTSIFTGVDKKSIDISSIFYNGGFGNSGDSYLLTMLSSVKELRLVGEGWDKNKAYSIITIDRAHNSFGYVLTIRDNVNGNYGSVLYQQTNVAVTEAGAGKYTKVTFPTDANNRGVEAVIDYNILTTGLHVIYTAGPAITNDFLIRSELIENIVVKDLLKGSDLTFPYAAGYLSHKNVLNATSNIDMSPALARIKSKRGVLAYRIDDNTIDEEFNAILENFGFKVTQYFNWATMSSQQIQQAREMQMRGHIIGDHTSNHNTNFFTIPTGYTTFFQQFVGNGIDSISGGKAFLTRQFFNNEGIDVSNTTNPLVDMPTNKVSGTFSGTAGSNRLTGSFSPIVQNSFIYVDNSVGAKIGWVKGVNGSSTFIDMVRDDEGPINLSSDDSNIQLYSVAFREAVSGTQARVTLGDQATYLLFLSGQIWAQVYGMEKPRSFAQTGGIWAALNESSVTKALNKLGMDFATLWYGDIEVTTNNSRQYDKILGMDMNAPNPMYLDGRTSTHLSVVKNYIANEIAKGKSLYMFGHHAFAYTQFNGATSAEKKENYRRFVYDLCKWLFENKIPVIGLSELNYLSNLKPENTNLIPNLYTDINTQGKPDGYTLGSGVTWESTGGRNEDKGRSLKKIGVGNIFTLTELGGLERGENEFSVWLKGSIGDSAGIAFGVLGEQIFTLASSNWQKFIVTIETPYNISSLDLTGRVISGSIEMSGMSLMKS